MCPLVRYPALFASLLFPFPLVILCLLISPVFVEVGRVEECLWNFCSSESWLWSLHNECESRLTLARTFGQLGGLCALELTSLCQLWFRMCKMGESHSSSEGVSSTLPLFALPWGSALGWIQAASHLGGSLFLPPTLLTYLSPHFGFPPPSQHQNSAHFWLTTLP